MPTDSNQRFLVPISSINDKDRIRQDYGDIDELANSISTLGLLQPIVIKLDGTLIAGGRRLRAMRKLGWNDVPVTYFEVADEVTLRILEVEENVRRKQMSWQERVLAIGEVHSKQALYKALNSQSWTLSATGELLGMSTANVSYALELASYIKRGDKEIAKCDRMWDAINLLVKRKAEESNKLLAKMTLPPVDPEAARRLLSETELDSEKDIFSSPTGPSAGGVAQLADDGEMPGQTSEQQPIVVPLSSMCLRQEGNGNDISIVRQLPNESIDHCITDWPFGIDLDYIDQSNPHGGMKGLGDVKAEHGVEANLALQDAVVPELYRILKPGGFFITWMDAMYWQRTYDLCVGAGFKVQRWPLVWHKTHRCMNQMALYNFTKDYEIAIVCRKGNATLITPQDSSIYMCASDAESKSLGHAFAKPKALWTWLYQAVTIKGQLVLDPFAGSGSSTLAAIQYGLQPLAIEVNEKHHASLVVNVSDYYRKTLKNVRFT